VLSPTQWLELKSSGKFQGRGNYFQGFEVAGGFCSGGARGKSFTVINNLWKPA
jgi:hypothetical protein